MAREQQSAGEPDRQPPKPRWYRLTPDRALVGLLPAVGLLWLSERFCWFPFNEHKNWTVLIAAAIVCAGVGFLLLWCAVSLVFRRRFQFGIRSLLVLVTVVAVVCSWFSVKLQQARRQREVVENVDGRAYYDHQLDANGWPLPKPPELPGPPWLRNLVGVDFLCDVKLLRCRQATDAGLAHLKELTSLEAVWLGVTEVTDARLAHLKGLASLKSLDLASTKVADAGLVHLKELTSLQYLCLDSTKVTDAGLEHLKGLTSLQVLMLTNTQVTDAGLVHLKGLTSLEFLLLDDKAATDAGVKKLQQALPNCEIPR